MKPRQSLIETLEPRIAPAAVTYTDVDGDLVKITVNKGPFDAADLEFVGGGTSGQLSRLSLADSAFAGASVIFSVTKKSGGDGFAHVGSISAFVDLDRVVVAGDLGQIRAGDRLPADDRALNELRVRSMGAFGLATQGGIGDLQSTFTGTVGAVKVAGDLIDAILVVTAEPAGAAMLSSVSIGGDLVGGAGTKTGSIISEGLMGRINIRGDLIGGAGSQSGNIISEGSIGQVRIGGDLMGGAGQESANIRTKGAIGRVTIGGDLMGGTGFISGLVFSAVGIRDVRVGGDLVGGTGQNSGALSSNLGELRNVRIGGDVVGGANTGCGGIFGVTLGQVRVGGSLIGGAGLFSGFISGSSSVGDVRLGGDLVGGSIGGAASLVDSGRITSDFGRIASVTVGGSLIAGVDNSSGTLRNCGAITAGHDLGPVKIAGNIVGNSANPAFILARGQQVKPTDGFDLAIASVTVGGDVSFARIFAGFDPLINPGNADAAIGAVTVGGDWLASSLVAGAQNLGADGVPGGTGANADNTKFGDGNDTLQTGDDTPLIARVASITIRGSVLGSLSTSDHFGFVAQQIDKLIVGRRVIPLTAGPSSDDVPFTGDLRLLEV